ncbi:hypothetical protein Tco_0796786 [Tanacetum coccineum]
MPPRMTTRSAGRATAAPRGGRTGGRTGRGSGRTRGQFGDQGNGKIDSQGGQVGGQCTKVNDGVDRVPNFSTIIAQQLQNLLLTILAQARILELKRRYFEDVYSEDQYVVSIKEDMAYLCLYSPKTMKEQDPIHPSWLKKEMADKETKSTMRDFAANDQADYYSGITSIVVNRKNAYELKEKFLDDLYKNAFSRTHGEDAVEHIEYFLKIFDPIDLPSLGSDEIEPTNEETSDLEETNHDDEQEIGAYIVGNTLRYKDLEWYNALKDSELKEEALRNKAIMEGLIDEDDESSNNEKERCELFDDHELSVCTIRIFESIKYSFGQDEEYVAIKEDEYKDLTITSEDACRAYQEIFRMMDEGWMVSQYGVFQFMDMAYRSPV